MQLSPTHTGKQIISTKEKKDRERKEDHCKKKWQSDQMTDCYIVAIISCKHEYQTKGTEDFHSLREIPWPSIVLWQKTQD